MKIFYNIMISSIALLMRLHLYRWVFRSMKAKKVRRIITGQRRKIFRAVCARRISNAISELIAIEEAMQREGEPKTTEDRQGNEYEPIGHATDYLDTAYGMLKDD